MSEQQLRSLAIVEYGKSPNDIRCHDSVFPIYGTGGKLGCATKPLFDGPLVVVARKGTLGRPHYSQGPCWIIDTAYAVHPLKGVDAKWLFYCLNDYDLESLNEATGVPSISRDYLYKVKLNAVSLPEQRKIASILTTVDNLIEQTEALIEKYKSIKQGMMHDLFTRGVDQSGQLRPPYEDAPELYKESELGWIPKEWDCTALGDQITLQRGFDITQAEQQEGTVPVVSSSGITSFHNKAMCGGPGVVIGRKGNLGKSYYLDRPYWPHDTSLWVKDFHGNNPMFSAIFLEHLRLERFDAATSVPTLNRNFVHPILVAMPRLDEQRLIVSRCRAISNTIVREQFSAQSFRQVKTGLMQDLLTGKVRVNVDETEEVTADV